MTKRLDWNALWNSREYIYERLYHAFGTGALPKIDEEGDEIVFECDKWEIEDDLFSVRGKVSLAKEIGSIVFELKRIRDTIYTKENIIAHGTESKCEPTSEEEIRKYVNSYPFPGGCIETSLFPFNCDIKTPHIDHVRGCSLRFDNIYPRSVVYELIEHRKLIFEILYWIYKAKRFEDIDKRVPSP